PQVDLILNRYADAQARMDRLPVEIQNIFYDAGAMEIIIDYHQQATDLSRQGLQAGAFTMGDLAAASLEGLVATGELVQPLFNQGVSGVPTIFEQALDTSSAEVTFFAFLDQLSTVEPKTIADVE